MIKFFIKRIQHAVGHGGFHTGRIGINDNVQTPIIHYVYDCGSEQKDALTFALAKHRLESKGHTDFLFVSHIHSDHINGIEQLQGLAPASTVVAPYLDDLDLIILALSEIERSSWSSSMREYVTNPVEWWRRRQAKRLIFIEPDDGNSPPSGTMAPPGDPTDPPHYPAPVFVGESVAKGVDVRLASRLVKPRRRRMLPELVAADPKISDGSDDRPILAGTGSSFTLEWQTRASAYWYNVDWILLPYVQPAEKSARLKFRHQLAKEFSVHSTQERKIRRLFLNALQDDDQIRKILEIYNEIFDTKHNSLSMSLYSGPERDKISDDVSILYNGSHQNNLFALYHSPFSPKKAGWLTTGDAMLKQQHRRKAWLKFFDHVKQMVACITLPHHGSIHNFHREILDFPNLEFAIATTIEANERVARMRQTLDIVESQGKISFVIDDRRSSAVTMFFQREADK